MARFAVLQQQLTIAVYKDYYLQSNTIFEIASFSKLNFIKKSIFRNCWKKSVYLFKDSTDVGTQIRTIIVLWESGFGNSYVCTVKRQSVIWQKVKIGSFQSDHNHIHSNVHIFVNRLTIIINVLIIELELRLSLLKSSFFKEGS